MLAQPVNLFKHILGLLSVDFRGSYKGLVPNYFELRTITFLENYPDFCRKWSLDKIRLRSILSILCGDTALTKNTGTPLILTQTHR